LRVRNTPVIGSNPIAGSNKIAALSPAAGIDWQPDGFGRVRCPE
jgi:hypothetical protein